MRTQSENTLDNAPIDLGSASELTMGGEFQPTGDNVQNERKILPGLAID